MIARIEQITTDSAGNLALHVSYHENGQQVNAQRFTLNAPVSRIVDYRNADGLLERLDGVAIPENPTTEEQTLAEQLGIRQEVQATDPAFIADFAVRQITSWAALHRRAVQMQAQVASANDSQMLAMAAGRAAHWAQVRQVALANGDQADAARAAQRQALAQSAAADAQVARALAQAEIAPLVAVLNPETPWPVGGSDPRGYLAMPAVAGLLGSEWEC